MSTKHEERLKRMLNEQELDWVQRKLEKIETATLGQERTSDKGFREKLVKRRDELLKDESRIAGKPKTGGTSPLEYEGKVSILDTKDPLYRFGIRTAADILRGRFPSDIQLNRILGIAEADINAGLKLFPWSEGGPRDDNQYARVQFADSGYPDPVSSLRFCASAKSNSKACAIDPAVDCSVAGIMKLQLPAAYRDGICKWACKLTTHFPEGIAQYNNAYVWGELWTVQSSTDKDFPEDINEYEYQYLWHKNCSSEGTSGVFNYVTGEFPVIGGEASCIFIGLSLMVHSRGDSYVRTRISDNYMGFPPDWPSFTITAEDPDTGERVDGLAYDIS